MKATNNNQDKCSCFYFFMFQLGSPTTMADDFGRFIKLLHVVGLYGRPMLGEDT